MKLNQSNYHSIEAANKYFSASRYKDLIGTPGIFPCEARVMAKLRGEWIEEPTNPMLVGSYVDSHFSGTLDVFKGQNPSLFKKNGELKVEFIKAESVITRIERDEYFMKAMSGEKQVIMTAELFGVEWSIMMDSYIPDTAIVDLKVMRSIRDSYFVKDLGRVSFVEYWGYDVQGAIYQEIVRLNTSKTLPFYIAAASKDEYPDIEVIGFTENDMKDALSLVEASMPRAIAVKSGQVEPDRCGVCDYCRWTKKLTTPIHYSKLI